MFHRMVRLSPIALASTLGTLAWLVALAGCQDPTSVSGTVTFRGQPVTKGVISMTPADKKGPNSGGKIEAGTYSIQKIQPGPKLVRLEGFVGTSAAPNEPTSSLDAHKQANAPRRPRQASGEKTWINPDTEGAYQEKEVVAGSQTINFDLEPMQ